MRQGRVQTKENGGVTSVRDIAERVFVSTAVHIEPQRSELVSGGRRIPVASVLLGGIPRGAVILLTSTGASAHDAADTMNRLAEHGYESVAADLGSATSGRTGPDHAVELADVAALTGMLSERGWSEEQTGLVGYGYGGRIALLASAAAVFGAAVSIEPAGVEQLAASPDRIGGSRGVLTPWLGMFSVMGEAARVQSLRTLGRWLWSCSAAYTQIVTYPGVTPAFYQDSRDAIGHAAAFDSWQRVIEWLNLRVVPRPTPLAEAWRARVLATQGAVSDVDKSEWESC
jgi:carboxymethylenebutenolidase